MKLAISSDHRGTKLVKSIIMMLNELSDFSTPDQHIEILDYSPKKDTSVDYPDYAAKVAKTVSAKHADKGILICGSGIGMSISANKFKNIRAALVYDENTATMCRKHNDANILCLGADTTKEQIALKLVQIFLETKFEGERHQRRIDKISKFEST
ncbi:MAG: ribose 5-phosphate isomerase B [Candidatus Heimdallarchaeota archaeon]|nr:ribose 5-phosphate isomerase B [Candidatus Heimdallarchaeota archaeon]